MTEAYAAALEASRIAAREYNAAREAYRRNGDTIAFGKAIAKNNAAVEAFDAAYLAEQKLADEREAYGEPREFVPLGQIDAFGGSFV